MNDIISVARTCKQIIKDELTIEKINYVHPNTNRVNKAGCITGNISNFEATLRKLVSVTKTKYPQISSSLLSYIEKYDEFPIRYFGRIEAVIECLINLEENCLEKSCTSDHRIFISHSSKDKAMVEDFVNHILMLGIGIESTDIFCTSIEEMNIKNGEDIRRHIHKNIIGSEYSILLLSDNYKASEICQNEMGAVWTNDATVRYYLLPNFTADKIGWLVNPLQAEQITNAVALDKLHEELLQLLGLKDTGIWSSQREQFLAKHK